MEERICEYTTNPLRIKIDWIHNLLQELEASGVALPCGDYNDAYDAIETVRDAATGLLAALNVCADRLGDMDCGIELEMARAAIAKADGGATE